MATIITILDTNDIVQKTGDRETVVMSQKAVTDEFNNVFNEAPSNTNWLNPEELSENQKMHVNGTISNETGCYLTGYIPVEEGEKLTCQRTNNWGTFERLIINMYFVTAFDANKNVLQNSGGSNIKEYTVPSNVCYIRVSFYSGSSYKDCAICKSTEVLPYEEYGAILKLLKNECLDADYIKTLISTELTNDAGIPDYVKTEAERVALNVIDKQNPNTFSILAITDTHYMHKGLNSEQIKASIVHAGQGADIIRSMANINLAVLLGDMGWDADENSHDDTIVEIANFNKTIDTAYRGIPNLRVKGNHCDSLDITDENGEYINKSYSMISSHNVGAVFDGENAKRGYCYRDFDDFKLRVIALNTVDVEGAEASIKEAQTFVSVEQMNWLAKTLVLDDKEDMNEWSILLISHHPLDYPTNYIKRVDELLLRYKEGTSGNVIKYQSGINYDFTNGKNGATIIGTIHGHTHTNKVGKLTDSGYVRIAIPNACFLRTNTYLDLDETAALRVMYADEVTFAKEANTAKDTAFCILTIDKSKGMLYASGYGATEDRDVYYLPISYTNQLPISTDTDGSIYNGKGFKEDTYMSGDGYATIKDKAGIALTGFIPIPETNSYDKGQVVFYFANAQIPKAEYTRITLYDADKNHMGLASATTFVEADTSDNIDKIAVWDENGYLVSLDHSETCYYYKQSAANKIAKYARICAAGIDKNTIITVNEPIE